MLVYYIFFCFKQKTAYEMRISDWSSDVCSSDLRTMPPASESSRNRFVFGNDGTVGTPATEITQASGCARLICSVSLKRLRNVSNSVRFELGRASCRERGCQYVLISVGAVSLKKRHEYNVK